MHKYTDGRNIFSSCSVLLWELTLLPVDEMAAILAYDNLKCIFLTENNTILIRISLKFVPKSPIDNKQALVQVMAWCQIGDNPLPELMLTPFTDAYMRHSGEIELKKDSM